jgi:hypothetical protein
MSRLFDIIRAWSSAQINRDPNLFPVTLRRDIAITLVVTSAISFWLIAKIGFLRVLNADGVILGIFGARLLYWETVATKEELESIGNQIAGAGSSTNLSFGEYTHITALSQFGLLVFGFATIGILVIARFKGTLGLHTALIIGFLFLWCQFPAFGMGLLIKLTRRWCNGWLRRFPASLGEARKDEIKRVLRASGFISLFVSGVMQLLALLV